TSLRRLPTERLSGKQSRLTATIPIFTSGIFNINPSSSIYSTFQLIWLYHTLPPPVFQPVSVYAAGFREFTKKSYCAIIASGTAANGKSNISPLEPQKRAALTQYQRGSNNIITLISF